MQISLVAVICANILSRKRRERVRHGQHAERNDDARLSRPGVQDARARTVVAQCPFWRTGLNPRNGRHGRKADPANCERVLGLLRGHVAWLSSSHV
jgi:hypothetical protein